jgi:hypothetical protein
MYEPLIHRYIIVSNRARYLSALQDFFGCHLDLPVRCEYWEGGVRDGIGANAFLQLVDVEHIM